MEALQEAALLQKGLVLSGSTKHHETLGQHTVLLLMDILIIKCNDSHHIFGLAFVLEVFLLSSAYLLHKNASLDNLGFTPFGNCLQKKPSSVLVAY